MKHTKFKLEIFKLELRDYELDLIEDALELYRDKLPQDSERTKTISKLIQKLYSEAYN